MRVENTIQILKKWRWGQVSWKVRKEISPVSLVSGLGKGVEAIRNTEAGIWVNMIDIVGENYIPFWKEGYASPTKGSKFI